MWRDSAGEGTSLVQQQKLLDDVHGLSWRVFDPQRGWRGETVSDTAPLALELIVSAGRFEQVRRMLLLPGALP
ncbi:Pseudopilin GspJ [compost metagenome]